MKYKLLSVGILTIGVGGLILYYQVLPAVVILSVICLIPPYILAWVTKTGVFEPWKKRRNSK